MTGHIVLDSDANAVTVTTTAPPLPPGYRLVELTDTDYDAVANGRKRWDQPSRTLVAIPQRPDLLAQLRSEASKVANTAQRNLLVSLVDQLG